MIDVGDDGEVADPFHGARSAAPGGGADYSRIAAGRLTSRDRREIAPYALLIERITRQLDVARREDRDAQTIPALERDAAVHVDGLDADVGAEQGRRSARNASQRWHSGRL